MDIHSIEYRRRDDFTRAALTGLLSNPNVIGYSPTSGFSLVNCTQAQLADYAVSWAEHVMHVTNQRDVEQAKTSP